MRGGALGRLSGPLSGHLHDWWHDEGDDWWHDEGDPSMHGFLSCSLFGVTPMDGPAGMKGVAARLSPGAANLRGTCSLPLAGGDQQKFPQVPASLLLDEEDELYTQLHGKRLSDLPAMYQQRLKNYCLTTICMGVKTDLEAGGHGVPWGAAGASSRGSWQ